MSYLQRTQRRMALAVAVANGALGIAMIVLTLQGRIVIPLAIPTVLLVAAAALFVVAFRAR